ncbi:MAG: nuclear transport factor 2 family protein [Gemmatimonadota bacterium]
MTSVNAEQAILSQERRALDRWSQGDPLGYLEIQAPDVTYFDDIAAQTRVDGFEAMGAYFSSLSGKIPPHRYEVQNPKVQLYGDTAVLTMRYAPFSEDGAPLPPWKATSVYHREDGEWRIVHAHWSMVKES